MKKLFLFLIPFIFTFTTKSQSLQENQNFQKNNYDFIENKGQIYDQNLQYNNDVLFKLQLNNGINVLIRDNGFSYDNYIKTSIDSSTKTPNKFELAHNDENTDSFIFHRVDIEILNANPNAEITPLNPSSDYINYYNPVTPESGVNFIQHYKKIVYKNIYPQIDLIFESKPGTTELVEYSFWVYPGADPSQIKLKYSGADSVFISDGAINLQTRHGLLKERIPRSYLVNSNNDIDVIYNITSNNVVAFSVSDYNTSDTLVIDPYPNKNWGTYFGGTGFEQCFGLTTDDNENIYISGYTESGYPIASSGAFQTSIGSSTDAYLAKFSKNGIRLWSTYYGGSGTENGQSLHCDGNSVIMTGSTTSSNVISTTGSHQATLGGSSDGFVVKFLSNGTRQWGTYYGGTNEDLLYGIDVDTDSNIYLSGYTKSSSSISTTGSFQDTLAGGRDIMLVKLNSGGVRQWATYYGGINDDSGYDIILDLNTNIYITGITKSDTVLSTKLAHQQYLGHRLYFDVFLAKFNQNGIRQWSTYYGGNDNDYVRGIDIDSNANIYFAGDAQSGNNISSSNAHQTTLAGYEDAFLTKFDSSGTRLWGTYLGTSYHEHCFDVCTDKKGNAFISGQTLCPSGFATTGAYQTTYGGLIDGFVAKFNTVGSLIWSTYVGGNFSEYPFSIVKPNNNIYLSGDTKSTNQIATSGSFQKLLGGQNDGFLMSFNDCSSFKPIIKPSNSYVCKGDSLQLIASGGISYSWQANQFISDTTIFNPYVFPNTHTTFYLTVSDTNFCEVTVAKTVIVRDIPNLVVSDNDTICKGDTVQIRCTGASKYFWSPASSLNDSTISKPLAFPSNYTVYYVLGQSPFNCTSKDSIRITVRPKPKSPSIDTIGSISFCYGDSVYIFTYDTAMEFKWNNGDSTFSIFADSSGIYYLQIEDSNGCLSHPSDSFEVIEFPLPHKPLIKVQDTNIFCDGDMAILSGPIGYYHYSWSNKDTSNSIIVDISGWFTLIIIDSNNCKSLSSDSVKITVHTLPIKPVIDYGNIDSFCIGDSVILNTNSNYLHYWNTGDSSQNLFVRNTGYFSVIVLDSNNCKSKLSDSILITFLNTPPKATIFYNGDTTFCQGDSIILYGQAGFQYSWSNSDTFSTIVVRGSGKYNLNLVNTFGCIGDKSDDLIITVKNKPTTPIISLAGKDSLFCSTKASQYYWLVYDSLTANNSQLVYTKMKGLYKVFVDSNGCMSDTSIGFYFIPSTLKKNKYAFEFHAYPVPTRDYIYILVNSNTENILSLDIINQFGVKLIQENNIKIQRGVPIKIQTKNLKRGVYFLQIRTTDSTYITKFIKA